MKFLNWFKDNINLISFTTGVIFIIAGKHEIGSTLIKGVPL